MHTTNKRFLFSTLACLTLCVTLSAQITSAQGPGDQGQGQSGQGQGRGQNGQNGQNGQGNRRQGFGGQNGGRGGFGGQMPFAMGTVTGGDATARTITIQSQFGGTTQTIQLGTTTQLVTQTTVTVADLKINDQVQVQGVPTGITANAITVGQMPTSMQGGGRGGFGGPGGQGGPNAGQNGGQNTRAWPRARTRRRRLQTPPGALFPPVP